MANNPNYSNPFSGLAYYITHPDAVDAENIKAVDDAYANAEARRIAKETSQELPNGYTYNSSGEIYRGKQYVTRAMIPLDQLRTTANSIAKDKYTIVKGNDGTYTMRYTDPNTNRPASISIAGPANKSFYTQDELNNIFNNSGTASGSVINATSGSSSSGYNAYAAQQAEALRIAKENARKSNAIINSILNNDAMNTATSAKSNYTLTDQDYAALRAAFPNYSDAQLTNMVAGSDWAKNFADSFSTTPTKSTLTGPNLVEYLIKAVEANDESNEITDATLSKQRMAMLKQIQNDPQLYQTIIGQLRADAATGAMAGQRAANLDATASAANAQYKSKADEMYQALTGGTDGGLQDKTRNDIYNNLASAYGNYTEQQLNALASDIASQKNDVQDLITMLSYLNGGITAEDAKLLREANDNDAKAANEATIASSKAQQEATASQAKANAAADYIATLAANATSLANGGSSASGVNANTYSSAPPTYGTGTFNNPTYSDAPYVDENLYQQLVNDPRYTQYLNPDVFKRYTTAKTEEQLANEYGLNDLLSPEGVSQVLQQYAQEGNKESDRVFNEAQKAYVSAIAAGDSKTAEQLTKLAQSAGTTKQNLYATTALSNQFNQQRANANVGNDMHNDQRIQRANNAAAITNAWNQGQSQRNTWLGNGDTSTAGGNSFRSSWNKNNQNAADARNAYGGLINSAMSSQSNINNTYSTLNNDSNKRLADYAAYLNQLNAQGAATNTANAGKTQSVKTTLKTQQAINNATLKR